MGVTFYDPQGDKAGGFKIAFASRIQYEVEYCKYYTGFPASLPTTREKVWRITKTGTGEDIRLTIHCNGVKVVDLQMSDEVCRRNRRNWIYFWNKDIVSLHFQHDSASDYYRPIPG